MRKAPVSLRNWIAFTLSSLCISATGLPTSLTLCSMSSSSRSDTLREMASGSRDSFSVAVNWRSMFSMASMRVMS